MKKAAPELCAEAIAAAITVALRIPPEKMIAISGPVNTVITVLDWDRRRAGITLRQLDRLAEMTGTQDIAVWPSPGLAVGEIGITVGIGFKTEKKPAAPAKARKKR